MNLGVKEFWVQEKVGKTSSEAVRSGQRRDCEEDGLEWLKQVLKEGDNLMRGVVKLFLLTKRILFRRG